MGIKKATKGYFRGLIDFRSWLGLGMLKNQTSTIKSTMKSFFFPAPPKRIETFEDAQKRFRLNEKDLSQRANRLLVLAIMMLIIGIAVISFAIYHLMNGGLQGFIVAMALGGVCLAMSFKHHFWYYQIKHKKLGCTFNEWFNGTFKGKHS